MRVAFRSSTAPGIQVEGGVGNLHPSPQAMDRSIALMCVRVIMLLNVSSRATVQMLWLKNELGQLSDSDVMSMI